MKGGNAVSGPQKLPQKPFVKLIDQKHAVIPACDCDAATLRELVDATHKLAGLGAYKIGFRLGLELGLPATVKIIREFTKKPIIYDHQKAGTDIPDTGKMFAEVCKSAGIDSVIFFPFTGPQVLKQWVDASLQVGLNVMVGGLMTHNGFLVSEGGFIDDGAAAQIYVQAADVGVKDFVLPATRSDFSWSIFSALKNRGHQPIFYSPGIGAQGGKWSDLCRADGPDWHAIAGRSLLANKLYGPNTQALLKEIPA